MSRFVRWFKREFAHNWASIIGLVVTIVWYVVNSFNPKSLYFAPQSVFGGGGVLVLPLSIVLIVLFALLLFWFVFRKLRGKRG